MFIRVSFELRWVFGDFQLNPWNADEQLLSWDDLLGDHI
jgi:hypothetical protein